MKKGISVAILTLGFLFCILGLCFPWIVFDGLAKFQDENFAVSGGVNAFGFGRNNYSAEVCVWSSPHGDTASTDFWYGYLVVCGLVLLFPAILFTAVKKTKISIILTLSSCIMVLASLVLALSYKPAVFLMVGDIPTSQGIKVGFARLYSDQAVINTGLGFLFSIFGLVTLLLGLGIQLSFKPMGTNVNVGKKALVFLLILAFTSSVLVSRSALTENAEASQSAMESETGYFTTPQYTSWSYTSPGWWIFPTITTVARIGVATQYFFIGPSPFRTPRFYSAMLANINNTNYYIFRMRIEVNGTDPNGNPLPPDRFTNPSIVLNPDSETKTE